MGSIERSASERASELAFPCGDASHVRQQGVPAWIASCGLLHHFVSFPLDIFLTEYNTLVSAACLSRRFVDVCAGSALDSLSCSCKTLHVPRKSNGLATKAALTLLQAFRHSPQPSQPIPRPTPLFQPWHSAHSCSPKSLPPTPSNSSTRSTASPTSGTPATPAHSPRLRSIFTCTVSTPPKSAKPSPRSWTAS